MAWAAPTLAAPGPAKPVVSPVATPMRLPASVQPLAYRLHLRVDPAQPRHSGEVAIDLQLHQPVQASGALRLHAKGLVLRTVWLDIGAHRWPGRVQRLDAEQVALHFGQPLPAGPVRLVIGFEGRQNERDVDGLFRQQDGQRWMAATQFQPTGARRAFPLFDEPGFKPRWTLALTVPQAMTALSNMPVAHEAAAAPGFKRVQFEPSPPLPSYLLAWAVGHFDIRDAGRVGLAQALPMRFATPPGRSGEADYAAGITGRIVEHLEAYFGSPYPFAKLDSLAVPVTLGFAAMEHPGLITYRASTLLATPAEQSLKFQRGYVAIAAHELAHQWFGNLVTLAWWDDLWLNESFASWLGDKITAEVQPGWGWHTSLQRARAEAMRADRLLSARHIEQPVQRDEDMGNLWDEITYEKGQAVLAMFEAWLGPEAFRAGVQRYMQRHAGGSATSADFFNALATEAPALPEAIRSFTRQGGIPRLGVALRCDGGPPRLQLSQSRLLPLGSTRPAVPQLWHLPITVRTPAGQSRLLLREAEASLKLPDATCPAWVVANAGGLGYWRTAYGGDLLARLAPGADAPPPASAPSLSTAEWLVLLDDAIGLHDAGDINSAQALALVRTAAAQPAREVVLAAAALLKHLQPLVATDQQAAYAAQWQSAFGERARTLGWLPRAADTDDQHLLRAQLLPAVAGLGQDAALRRQALALAQAWLADRSQLPADLRGPVLATATLADGPGSGPDFFYQLVAALNRSTLRSERGALLGALGSFRQPALGQRARAVLLFPEIDLRDSLGPLLAAQTAQTAQPAMRADALAFVVKHHAQLARGLGHDAPAWLPAYFDSGCSEAEARSLQAGLGPSAPRFQGGQQALARALEAVRLCTAWRGQQASGL